MGNTPYDAMGGAGGATATLNGAPVSPYPPPSATDIGLSAAGSGMQGFGSGSQGGGSKSVQLQDFSPLEAIQAPMPQQTTVPVPSQQNQILAMLLQQLQGLGG